MKHVVLLLSLACGLNAQVAHPRIWLDSATKTRLLALVAANDPTWVAVKAQADAYLSKTVISGLVTCDASTSICWQSQYDGWVSPVQYLGLAYQMTGNTAYSDQLKLVLESMVSTGVGAVSTPTTGYGTRTAVLSLGLGYDWIYDQLSVTDKTNICALLDAYWNFVQTGTQVNAWTPGTGYNAYNNFFTGHMVGFGVAALATEGDDANYTAMMAVIQGVGWNNYVVPSFTSPAHRLSTSLATGGAEGGYPEESWNYGGNGLIRLLQYANAYETAGKGDLGYRTWAAKMATEQLYDLQPDWWSVTMEGAYPGSRHLQYQNYSYILSNYLQSQTEGGWMKYMGAHLVSAPGGTPSGYLLTPFEAFFYNNPAVTAVDYTATQPTSYFSPGDNHTFAKTDWTTSAVEATFSGQVNVYASHQAKNFGHIAVQRGGDFLLIHAGEWSDGTQYGITGSPSTYNEGDSWPLNELYYYDGGSAAGGYCLSPTSGLYAGCKGNWGLWGLPNTILHKETASYTYQKADLRAAYFDNFYTGGRTTITSYNRSFVFVNGITFVYDLLTSSASTRTVKQFWHFNGAATNSLTGNVVKTSVGTSNLFVIPVLPASPTVALAPDMTTWGGSTQLTTRAEISDPANPATTQLLTVLAPTDASVATAPPTTALAPIGFVGALYADSTPRVVLFSADGTPQVSATYSVSYDSQLRGCHVILDLMPGFYTVWHDGVMLIRGILVGKDGSLSFKSNGGGTFAVGLAALPSAAFHGDGGVNGRAVVR